MITDLKFLSGVTAEDSETSLIIILQSIPSTRSLMMI